MLKWHQNLISFGRPLGRRLFRHKRRQEAPAPQIAAEDEVGRGPVGEDLGGGTRTSEKKNPERDEKKNPETWHPRSTRRPRLGGGLLKAAPWYRRASLLGPQEALGHSLGRFSAVLGGSWAVLEASWGPLEGVLVSWGRLESFVGRLGRVLGRLGGVLVGNMAPTWLPKRNQHRLKIEAKNVQKIDAS